jgi:hypothetical protein
MKKTSWLGFVIFVSHANILSARFLDSVFPAARANEESGREILFVFPKFRAFVIMLLIFLTSVI